MSYRCTDGLSTRRHDSARIRRQAMTRQPADPPARGGGRAIPGAGRGEETLRPAARGLPRDCGRKPCVLHVESRSSVTVAGRPASWTPPSSGTVKPLEPLDKQAHDGAASRAAKGTIRCVRATIDGEPAQSCKSADHRGRLARARPTIDLPPSSRQSPRTGTGGATGARHGEEDACISSCTGC